MKEIKIPKTITLRMCPKCGSRQSWSVHGFAYPGGLDSSWFCTMCKYIGKPKYELYYINPITKQENDLLKYALNKAKKRSYNKA